MALKDILRYAVETKTATATAKPQTTPPALGLQANGAGMYLTDAVTKIDSSKNSSAFSLADEGDTSLLATMTLEMLSNNSSIAAHWGTRRNSLLGLDWDIVDAAAANKKAKKSKDADTLRQALDNGTLRTVIQCLADVPLLGFGGALIEWDSTLKTPIKAMPIHPTRWIFDLGGNPAIWMPDADGKPIATALQTMTPGQAVFGAYSSSSHPGRCGMCRPLLWLHLFRQQGMMLRANYIERFGMPYIDATLTKSQWEDEDLRKKFMATLEESLRKNVVLRMEGTQVDIKAHTGAAANADHSKWLSDLDLDAARLILGQTGTSGDSSGMSNGGAQTEVRKELLTADARALAEAIATCLLRPTAAILGIKEPERFEFVFDLSPPDDMAVKATMVKTLAEAGYKADRNWISETFGIPLDETIDVTPIAIPPAPGVKQLDAAPIDTTGDTTGDTTAKPAEPDTTALFDTVSKSVNLDKLAADSAAGVASRSFDTAEEAAAMFNPIRNAVRRAFDGIDTNAADWQLQAVARLQSLQESLPPALRSMDWSAFETALKEAMNAAAVEAYQ